VSLKKRISDRIEAREVVTKSPEEVPPTHTEKMMFVPHPARVLSRNKRKQKRRAARR
jgi:hypothetical protein